MSIPARCSSAPVPTNAVCGHHIPADTRIRATLVSVSLPFAVDSSRNQVDATVAALCHCEIDN